MPGTKRGGKKARATLVKRYGKNVFSRLGKKGGHATARRWKELTGGR